MNTLFTAFTSLKPTLRHQARKESTSMNPLLTGLLPLTLLACVLTGCSHASSSTATETTADTKSAVAKIDKTSSTSASSASKTNGEANGLDSLCDNHYNKLGLPAGKFEQIADIIDKDKKASVPELKAMLDAKKITLNEASWALYYLGQKSLKDDDYKSFVKYLTIAADDYLNPWAMTLLAKVYYHDKADWQKDFPKAEITTDKDLEKSYTYLTLAFVISGEIEKEHHDNAILTGVTNGGLALKDTFEGTGVSGFDPKATLEKHKQELMDRAATYKKLYETGK